MFLFLECLILDRVVDRTDTAAVADLAVAVVATKALGRYTTPVAACEAQNCRRGTLLSAMFLIRRTPEARLLQNVDWKAVRQSRC